jgi:Tat protein secretion system quality control protein TatD with DNase activity
MVFRNGSLTMAPKPGIAALLQTWPYLYVGLSAKLAFSKCPQSLLNATFDLPMDKILLTSEAPLCLPPALCGSPHLVESCLPHHVACVAETVAVIKKGLTRREAVLEASANNVCRAFGLPPLSSPKRGGSVKAIL